MEGASSLTKEEEEEAAWADGSAEEETPPKCTTVDDSKIDDQSPKDPFHLTRFTDKQRTYHRIALVELKAGRKSSCWSWYILPTPPFIVNGKHVGSSINSFFALASDEETRAYLRFTHDGVDLRRNYIEIMRVIGDQLAAGMSAVKLLGMDAKRLAASVAHFERVSRDMDGEMHSACARVVKLLPSQEPVSKRQRP